jgi:hypothetical protein
LLSLAVSYRAWLAFFCKPACLAVHVYCCTVLPCAHHQVKWLSHERQMRSVCRSCMYGALDARCVSCENNSLMRPRSQPQRQSHTDTAGRLRAGITAPGKTPPKSTQCDNEQDAPKRLRGCKVCFPEFSTHSVIMQDGPTGALWSSPAHLAQSSCTLSAAAAH